MVYTFVYTFMYTLVYTFVAYRSMNNRQILKEVRESKVYMFGGKAF